jgi:hypothetical protein
MAISTRTIAVLGVAGILVAPAAGAAQTQADFDTCNEQAKVMAATPSASPSASGGSTMTSPGNPDANRQPNATGRISGSAGSPGTGAGTTGIGATAAGGAGGPAYGSEVQLRGMASAGAGDDAYRQAYRDCMKARGF